MDLLHWLFGESTAVASVRLTDVEQRGSDTYADIWLRREWIEEGRTISVDNPAGRKMELRLHPVMEDGKYLRLNGQAFEGCGDLLLRVCIVK
jgi:hypothetical protein